jgi:hypothetical protein
MPSWRAIDSDATDGAQRIALFPPFMRGIPSAGSPSYLLQVLMFTFGVMGALVGIAGRRTMPTQCTSHGLPGRLGLNSGNLSMTHLHPDNPP